MRGGGRAGRAGAVSGHPSAPRTDEVRRQRPAEEARTERQPRPKPGAAPAPPRLSPGGAAPPGLRTAVCRRRAEPNRAGGCCYPGVACRGQRVRAVADFGQGGRGTRRRKEKGTRDGKGRREWTRDGKGRREGKREGKRKRIDKKKKRKNERKIGGGEEYKEWEMRRQGKRREN